MVTAMDIINEHASVIAVPSAFSSALFPWRQHHSPPSATTETWPTVVIKFHTCTGTCTSSTPHTCRAVIPAGACSATLTKRQRQLLRA